MAFDFSTMIVRVDGIGELNPAVVVSPDDVGFKAGNTLPVLEVELLGEAFDILRKRMGGTERKCLLRILRAAEAKE